MTPEHSESTTNIIHDPANPPVCLVLLGASNLARGWFALTRYMKACLHPRPVEVLIATGPGRAYRAQGGLLNVVYPPIQSSSIFEAAREKSEAGYQLLALVTDMGNDIMYGVTVDSLIETMEQVFDRLRTLPARIHFTTLPVRFEQGVHPAWYYFLRTVLLPSSRVSFEEARQAITRFNGYLRESASAKGHMIPDMDRFLGYDEIHYGWFQGRQAWTHVGRCMLEGSGAPTDRTITGPEIIRSYWEDIRKIVATDMAGFKDKHSGHY